MKLSTGILLATLVTGTAVAQNPSVIQNTRTALQAVQQKQTQASNEALAGTKPAAKPAPAKPVVASKPSPAPASAAKPAAAPSKPAAAPASVAKTAAAASKPQSQGANKSVAPKAVAAAKPAAAAKAAAAARSVAKAAPAKKADAPADKTAEASKQEKEEQKKEQKKEQSYVTAGNRRDPFISPVVQHMAGSGCNTGKRCLAVDQISLRGIVRSESGMIAVVVNALDKAYFLRENDPVFNGYVVKISGDSVVFKETVQDRLGKTSTREVVKKLTTPAV